MNKTHFIKKTNGFYSQTSYAMSEIIWKQKAENV